MLGLCCGVLSSSTGDQTHVPALEDGFLITGPFGKLPLILNTFYPCLFLYRNHCSTVDFYYLSLLSNGVTSIFHFSPSNTLPPNSNTSLNRVFYYHFIIQVIGQILYLLVSFCVFPSEIMKLGSSSMARIISESLQSLQCLAHVLICWVKY